MSAHVKTLNMDQAVVKEGNPWFSLPKIGFGLGILGLIVALLLRQFGGDGSVKQFAFSWLTAYMYFLHFALGALFFVLLHFAAKSGWSTVLRRLAENMMVTIPVFILLFIPIFMNFDILYGKWLNPPADDHLIPLKAWWLNKPFFMLRIAIYFAVWSGLAFWFRKMSTLQDKSGDHALTRKMQAMSYPGIMLFVLSMTGASLDWMKSLDPHWYSTMYGVIYFAGCMLMVFCILSILTVALPKSGLLKDIVSVEHYHDLGKYMFGFTIFWTYVSFSQFMLQWYGNIPEETLYYVHRNAGSWASVSKFLIIGHFAIPFGYLLVRQFKRQGATLVAVAIWLMMAHYIFVHWQIMPNYQHHGPHYNLMDIAALVSVGGFFLGAFGLALKKDPIVPVKDPRLSESLNFENF
jgi:hypothetical protein